MATAITCDTCGKYVRKKAYRKHLRDAHGIGTDEPHVSPVSPLHHGAAKPSAHAVAPAAKKGSVSHAHAPMNHPRSEQASISQPGLRVSHRVTASLEPSKKHRDALDQIFLAPEFCLYLLLTHQPAIRTRADAQIFLLKYKREIDGYLPLRNRSELIDLLSDFMLQWSMHFPDQIGLQFDCQVVSDGSDAFARVAGIGDILLDGRSIRGELPRSSLEASVMIGKEQENYRLDFVYEDTYAEPVSTAARVRSAAHDGDSHVVMPAPSLRADGQLKPRKANTRKPSVIRPTLVASSPRTARSAQSRTAQLEVCPLCGKGIERGGMLMHKRDSHGETMYSPSPLQTVRRCAWVAIYQGGAPGLGKGKS